MNELVAKATFDLEKFDRIKHNGVEQAFKQCLKLESGLPEMVDTIWYLTDWGEIYRVYQIRPQKTMNILLYRVVCEGLTRYTEEYVSKTEIKLKESKEDYETFMVYNDFIPNAGHCIKTVLWKNGYNFENDKWKMKVDLE